MESGKEKNRRIKDWRLLRLFRFAMGFGAVVKFCSHAGVAKW